MVKAHFRLNETFFRWSQIMYMYYFLGYKINGNVEILEKG